MPLVIGVFRFSASAGDMAANRSLLISQADVFERGNSQSVLRIVSIADRRWCCDGEAEKFSRWFQNIRVSECQIWYQCDDNL